MSAAGSVGTESVKALDYAVAGLFSLLLYLGSAVLLDSRYAITHFGADGHLYEGLAQDIVHDRIVRFHPLTVVMSAVWMKLFGWLSLWIEPKFILKAMFAVVGAAGVAAAISAFAAFMPRREAMLCGAIYALSFSVWYFAGIEESKIVTATFAAAYIAIYLRYREELSVPQIMLLSVVLFAACLNEITSCFLAAIPAVELLLRRDRRRVALLVVHVFAGCIALAMLEYFARVVFPGQDSEGATHASMFFDYFTVNDYGLATLYDFASNWFLFNIAAPSSTAVHLASAEHQSAGYFAPGLSQYLSYPFALAALLLLSAMFAAGLTWRASSVPAGILLALVAYSLVRGAFFFLFNPQEPLLFSAAVTLPHLIVLIVPFASSAFAWKGAVLGAVAVGLFVANGAFFVAT